MSSRGDRGDRGSTGPALPEHKEASDKAKMKYKTDQAIFHKKAKELRATAPGKTATQKVMELEKLTLESDEVVKTMNRPAFLVSDAALVKNISENLQDNAKKIVQKLVHEPKGGRTFTKEDFASLLATSGRKDKTHDKFVTVGDWADLAKLVKLRGDNTGSLKAPEFSCVWLSPEKEERPLTPARARPAANCASRPSAATRIQSVDNSMQGKDRVQAALKVVLRTLSDALKTRPEKTLNLFELTLDPNDFGRSVENLFWVAQLVKDRKVALIEEGEDGFPHVYPAHGGRLGRTSGGGDYGPESDQLLLKINMRQWREVCQFLELTEPMIPDI